MDALTEGLKIVSEAKDWVTLLACIAFMIIFWDPIAHRLGWKEEDKSKGLTLDTFKAPESNKIMADVRNALSPLYLEMQTLSQHFNHETTDQWSEVKSGITGLHTKLDEHLRQTDRTNYLLEDIKNNGIKCRKE